MTETVNQLLSRVVPVCTCVNSYHNILGRQFWVFPTIADELSVEDNAKYQFYSNVICPVQELLGGARFRPRCTGMLDVPDFILCTNNLTTAKMLVEVKTHHNLRLGDHNLWEVYRYADRNQIEDENFQFKKRILSQQAINDNVGNRLDPKRKSSLDLGSRKRVIASSSKRVTRIGEYIEQEATKMLKHEAHVYSILKECQGRAIPHLFHQGYIYDRYLFA
ncbi:708_t:CDS:2, partial [Funneliformis caledonium]